MSLKTFQTKIGANPDGDFGKETLLKAMIFLKLTKEQAAHFFAQVAHETCGFRLFEENLNYSSDGLRKIFGKYFPTNESTNSYARKPEKIASKVYGSRMGNGEESTSEGWKFRGRGAIQLTGKSNYKAFAESINDLSILTNPDLVADKYAFESAIYFFNKNKLWDLCKTVDDASITKVSKKINGGTNGLQDRIEYTKKYYNLIK